MKLATAQTYCIEKSKFFETICVRFGSKKTESLFCRTNWWLWSIYVSKMGSTLLQINIFDSLKTLIQRSIHPIGWKTNWMCQKDSIEFTPLGKTATTTTTKNIYEYDATQKTAAWKKFDEDIDFTTT